MASFGVCGAVRAACLFTFFPRLLRTRTQHSADDDGAAIANRGAPPGINALSAWASMAWDIPPTDGKVGWQMWCVSLAAYGRGGLGIVLLQWLAAPDTASALLVVQ